MKKVGPPLAPNTRLTILEFLAFHCCCCDLGIFLLLLPCTALLFFGSMKEETETVVELLCVFVCRSAKKLEPQDCWT